MKNSLIIIGFLLPVLALASLTEKTEHLDRGKKGVAEKLVIFRDGAPIYERYRQDRNRDGIFEHYIESFIMDGQNVLQFTFIGGSRGTVVRGNTEAQVILSSEKDSWRPDGVLIDIKGKKMEMYTLRSDGFYRPVDDEEKARIEGISKAGDDLFDSAATGDAKGMLKAVEKLQNTPAPKPPNQAPLPTPMPVTPPAGQEARQP